MIKLEDKPYHLTYCELGDHDNLDSDFKTLEQAQGHQKDLIKNYSHHGYYTTISRIIEVRRKEPREKEQKKTFKEEGKTD